MAELPVIELDPRNEAELLEQATQYVFTQSNGLMGNQSAADPLSFLLEGQVFAGAELLWYLNQLPDKLLAQWLGYWGVTLSDGAFATGVVTVTLSGTFTTPLPLPANLIFSTPTGLQFKSTSAVTVPANTLTVDVPVVAVELGTKYNIQRFEIQAINTPLAYLRSATNTTSFSNGLDQVDAPTAIRRYVKEFKDEALVSKTDYLRACYKFLGGKGGWIIRIAPNIDPDTNQQRVGTVAVMVGNVDQPTINQSLLVELSDYLQDRAMLSINPWVTFLDPRQIDVKVYATVEPTTLAEEDRLTNELVGLVRGLVIDENARRLSTQELIIACDKVGLKYVAGSLNGTQSVTARNQREYLLINSIEIRLSNPQNGNTYNDPDGRLYFYGQGDPD